MKIADLRKKTEAELREELHRGRMHLFQLRMKVKTNQLKDVAQIHKVKKLVARIQTLLRGGKQ